MKFFLSLLLLTSLTASASLVGPSFPDDQGGGFPGPKRRTSRTPKVEAKTESECAAETLLTPDKIGTKGAWGNAATAAYFRKTKGAIASVANGLNRPDSSSYSYQRALIQDGFTLERTVLHKKTGSAMGTGTTIHELIFVRVFKKNRTIRYVGGNMMLDIKGNTAGDANTQQAETASGSRVAAVAAIVDSATTLIYDADDAPAKKGDGLKAVEDELTALIGLVDFGNAPEPTVGKYRTAAFTSEKAQAELQQVLESPYEDRIEGDRLKFAYALDFKQVRRRLDKKPFEYELNEGFTEAVDRLQEAGLIQAMVVGWLDDKRDGTSYSMCGIGIYLKPSADAPEGRKLVFYIEGSAG